MRYYNNRAGNGFTVAYSADDAAAFSRRWPCSTVHGRGSFSFAGNGDLVDAHGTAFDYDGDDWLAFSQDCQNYGNEKHNA